MGFVRRFLSHFLFAVEKKVQTFPYQSLRLTSFGTSLYTREALVRRNTRK